MKHFNTTAEFYQSNEWHYCKEQVLHERIKENGAIICEHCHKEITKGFNNRANNNSQAIVFHHKIYLNNYNINDASISINPANIQILHWRCHNEIHNRFGFGSTQPEKKVYLITGAPLSGKTTYAKERVEANDLVLDIDDIWQTISKQPRYIKPNALKAIVFQLRDDYKGLIARGVGSWRNAYIIESLPNAADRARELEKYKAHNTELIQMEATEQECLQRLHEQPNGRDIKEYERFIKEYFERYTKTNPPSSI